MTCQASHDKLWRINGNCDTVHIAKSPVSRRDFYSLSCTRSRVQFLIRWSLLTIFDRNMAARRPCRQAFTTAVRNLGFDDISSTNDGDSEELSSSSSIDSDEEITERETQASNHDWHFTTCHNDWRPTPLPEFTWCTGLNPSIQCPDAPDDNPVFFVNLFLTDEKSSRKKTVYLLDTSAVAENTSVTRKIKGNREETVEKPSLVLCYNANMGGMDLLDASLHHCDVNRKS